MQMVLTRRINLGNYEHYELTVEDEFNTWDEGFKEMVRRIREAEQVLGRKDSPVQVKKV
jgi:hypothetical protein